LRKDLAGSFAVTHQEVLGDFEFQRRRRQPAVHEQLVHSLGQFEVDERGRREVDGDAEHPTGSPPKRDLVEGLLEHGHREVAHEARILGERQERVGWEQPVHWVIPANKRFDA